VLDGFALRGSQAQSSRSQTGGRAVSIPLLDDAAGAVHNLLSTLVAALAPLDGGAAVAVAVVLLTALVRLCLLPLSMRRARAQRAQTALTPRLLELREKHGRDPLRLQTEIAALYQSAGTSPLATLTPTLLQAPAFMVLYRVFTVDGSGPLLSAEVFGYPLAAHGLAAGWPLLVLVAALAVVATLVARRASRAGAPKWTLALPYLTVLPAVFVPLAAGLYLLTSTAWSAVENAVLPGRSQSGDESVRTAG
jgi:YidC/Oxa1 family membrane protein insertase